MNWKKMLLAAAVAGIGALGLSNTGWAQAFPGAGSDTTASLGQFSIVIQPYFQPLFASQPPSIYNPTTKTMTSPLLYDPATMINRSSNIPVSASPPYTTNLANITVFPSAPGYAGAPLGQDSVFTNIGTMNMTGAGGVSVTAGAAATTPTVPTSYGLVTSNQTTPGDSANDFPAHSFFDIFVDVTIPGLPTLSNNTPLLVQTPSITSFPPTVVYIHGNTSAVPLYFDADNPGLGITAGDLLGIITLAGHGVTGSGTAGSQGPTDDEIAAFDAVYNDPNMNPPMPALPQYSSLNTKDTVPPTNSWNAAGLNILPEPASLSLLCLGAAGLVFRRRRSA